ncbi:hypothetical protein Bbelb_366410 [Branchiostoma belcheri]|nr:hypothetical protein Bbelb_366410 [Branchiostoma belcheri]
MLKHGLFKPSPKVAEVGFLKHCQRHECATSCFLDSIELLCSLEVSLVSFGALPRPGPANKYGACLIPSCEVQEQPRRIQPRRHHGQGGWARAGDVKKAKDEARLKLIMRYQGYRIRLLQFIQTIMISVITSNE